MSSLDITIFVIFLLVSICCGLYASRNVQTVRGYAIGNKQFSTTTIVSTIAATWIGGSDFFRQITETYVNGLYFLWAFLGDCLCSAIVISFVFVPKMSEFLGKISIGEAMGDLFGKNVRIITAAAGCIGTAGLVATELKVSGLLLSYCFNTSIAYGIVVGGVISLLYSAFGGIKSVAITDVLQLSVFGVIVPIVACVLSTFSNMSTITEVLTTNHMFDYKQVFDFTSARSFSYLCLFLFLLIPGFSPAVFQRIAMARDISQARKSFFLGGTISSILALVVCWVGVVILATYPNIADKNEIVKYVLFGYSITGFKGLALVGIMSMILSTADAYINATSVLFIHDFCKPLKFKFMKNELLSMRLFAIIFGIFSMLIAYYGGSILEIIIMTSGFYMTIVSVPFILAIWKFRSTSKSVLIGMFGGFLSMFMCNILQIEDIVAVILSMLVNAIFLISSHCVFKQCNIIKNK